MTPELREKIAEAAAKFDGHVTNGSLDEICKVVDSYLTSLSEKLFDIHLMNDEED